MNVLIKDSSKLIELYRFPNIDALGFKTFVTGRGGGFSAAPFDTLNTAANGGDDEKIVSRNIKLICDTISPGSIWAPNQVHGDNIAYVTSCDDPVVEADAVIVTKPGISIAVRTADCLPMVVVDPKIKVAAVVHAGRVGTEKGIAKKVVTAMVKDHGATIKNINATIAPSIRQCCYEVDEKSAANFATCCGSKSVHGRYVDIVAANIFQLMSVGLSAEKILDSEVCTACNSKNFYSYRADRQKTGRFMTGVAILPYS